MARIENRETKIERQRKRGDEGKVYAAGIENRETESERQRQR